MISRRNQFLTIALVLMPILAGCSQTATGPASPAPGVSPGKTGQATSVRFVKASAVETLLSAGGSGEAIVRVTVQTGYHVNANPPTESYLKATELTVQPSDGITVGFLTYPTAVTKKFAFAEKPLAVYEGEVPIKVMLKAAGSATKGARSIPAKLNVQACDDQVCYPPGSLELTIPAIIK